MLIPANYSFGSNFCVVVQVVLGISSFLIEPMCQRMGARLVWALSNFIVFACMAGTAIISLISVGEYSNGIQHVIGGNETIKTASLVVFALLGFPLAVRFNALEFFCIWPRNSCLFTLCLSFADYI